LLKARLLAWLVFHLVAAFLAVLGTVVWGVITDMRADFGGFTTSPRIALATWLTLTIMSGYIITTAVAFLALKRASLVRTLGLLALFTIHYIGFMILLAEVVVQVAVCGFFLGAIAVFIASFVAATITELIFCHQRIET